MSDFVPGLAKEAVRQSLESVDWDFEGVETGYLTHGLHPYPAKFIPQIPRALIRALSQPGETVADVFCGSGTTLVEALLLGRNAVGVDANELACVISQAKTAKLTSDDLRELEALAFRIGGMLEAVDGSQPSLFAGETLRMDGDLPRDEAIRFWFDAHVIEELAAIRSLFRDLPDRPGVVAKACFSSIIVAVSKQDSDTRYVRRQKHIVQGDVLRRFLRALRDAVAGLRKLAERIDDEVSCRVLQADVLTSPNIGSIDLVVSSPPYPNAYSYHLYHMTRMLWLGMDQPTFKRREIGSHRKYSKTGPNGATVGTFRGELERIFEWLGEHIRLGGHCCFVIGDSIIKGRVVRNDELVIETAEKSQFALVTRVNRRLQESRKAFNPKIGRIREERIIILRRDK